MGVVGLSFGSASSGSGFDVASTVSSIVANLQQVETPWNTQLSSLKADDAALTSIGTDLASLTTSLNALTDFQGVLTQKLGSSSNPDVLTLSAANSSASAGSHTITVNQLSQTSSKYTDPIASSDTISGALTLRVGSGPATTVAVVAGISDTLATYAAAINYAGIGITASVVSDASGSRLSLSSKTSGAGGALTVTQGGTTAASSAPVANATSVTPTATVDASNIFTLPFSASQISGNFSYSVGTGATASVNLGTNGLSLTAAATALNANAGFSSAGLTATVNGAQLIVTGAADATGAATINTSHSALTSTTSSATYAGLADVTAPANTLSINTGLTGQDASLTVDGVLIYSASNIISTAIPGVTFQILSKSTGPVQVEITNDNAAIETTVNTFVSAYNKVVGDLKTQEGNSTTGSPEPLYGNPVIAQLQSALSLALTTGTSSGSIHNLAQLGVSVGNTGTLAFDSSTLDAALNSSYTDVVGFMQNVGGFGQSLASSLANLGNTTPDGALTLALAADATQEKSYNDDVTAQDALIATQKTNLTAELTTANEVLQSIPQQLNEVNELYSALTGYNTQKG